MTERTKSLSATSVLVDVVVVSSLFCEGCDVMAARMIGGAAAVVPRVTTAVAGMATAVATPWTVKLARNLPDLITSLVAATAAVAWLSVTVALRTRLAAKMSLVTRRARWPRRPATHTAVELRTSISTDCPVAMATTAMLALTSAVVWLSHFPGGIARKTSIVRAGGEGVISVTAGVTVSCAAKTVGADVL